MKTLIAYYSFDGNTKLVAQELARTLEADLLEVKPKKDIPHNFLKFFLGGMGVVKKQTPELLPLDKNPEEYDLLVIGTPVWASSFVPAIRTFLTQHPVKGKKVAFFCCFGGQEGRTFEELKAMLPGNEFVGQLGLRMPLKHREEINKLQPWAASLK